MKTSSKLKSIRKSIGSLCFVMILRFDALWFSIFNYLNEVINYVQPRKLIFIAIDGVAPRAKMNQ